MNTLKRVLGVLWILIGIAAVYYLIINQAIPLWNKGGENVIPAIIYTFVLGPIIAGSMGYFGYYSIKGEYSKNNDK